MTPEAAEKLEKFFSGFAGSATPLLLLDYDGTLAPFRVDRFQSRPWAGVRQLLQRIQRQGRTRMAVITGRPANEIAPMLALDSPLEVWGLHGAERLYPDGRRELEQPPQQTRIKLDELKASLRRDSFGGLFEDKANGAVMHWRGASAKKARRIEARTRALFEPLAMLDGLMLLDFEAGLELRAGRNKGEAVRAIIDEAATQEPIFPTAIPAESISAVPVAYLGDDLSDESAFQAVNAIGPRAISILVRREPRETDANIWLRPPEDLRSFLKRWAEACSSQPQLAASESITTNH